MIFDSKFTTYQNLEKLDKDKIKFITLFRQIIVSGNGHEKEAFIITNDRERTTPQVIRQYGKRWNVEKGISEQIEIFHLNSQSSSIVVKVDFDLTMSIAAHNFYRIIAQDLTGFERETSSSLNGKFFNNGGQFLIQNGSITIEMKKKRHLPLLMDALFKYQNEKIPWLDNRKLIFKLWATS